MIKVYTSYYGSPTWRNNPNLHPVSIARILPRGITHMDEFCKVFAPPQFLINLYKSGKVTDEGYKDIYIKEVLARVNMTYVKDKIERIKEMDKDVVLLCYEKTGDFCHRHIVREFLEENGYTVEEL